MTHKDKMNGVFDHSRPRMVPCECCGNGVNLHQYGTAVPLKGLTLQCVGVCPRPACQSHIEKAPVNGVLDENNYMHVYSGPRRTQTAGAE